MVIYLPFLKRGITLTPWLILIPKWAKVNVPYLAHEKTHATQQRLHGTLKFWWRYLTDKTARQAYEVQAYKTQIANGASAFSCANQLALGYGLNITHAQAMELLK